MKLKPNFLLPWLILYSSSIVYAQADKPFSIEQIMSASFPSELTAASNSDKIAWVFNQKGKRNIWIAESPGFNGKQLTNYSADDGQEIGTLAFTGDASEIIFVKGGAPNRQGEIPNPTSDPAGEKRELWKVATSGGEPLLINEGSSPALSPDDKILAFIKSGQIWIKKMDGEEEANKYFTIRGRADNLQWSPDGNYLAFVSNRGDHSYVGIYDLQNEQIKYLDPTVDRDGSPVWSSDSERIAWLRMPNQRDILPFMPRRSGLPWSIMQGNVKSGEVRKVWQAAEGAGSVFRFISAASQLFWAAGDFLVFPYEKSGWTHLHAVSVSGGQERDLTPGNFEVQYVSISPDKKAMFYSSNQNDIDRQHIWSVNISGGSPVQLTKGNGIEWSPVNTPVSGTLFTLTSGPTTPAIVAKIDKSGKITNIAPGSIPKDFPSGSLVEPEQVIFSAADGMKIHGQLFLPKNRTGKKPALLFFHGGSRRQMLLGFHHRGYYHNAYSLNQYFASQGYVVLSVNYRSGIGYGMEFREALNYGARGASEYNDVLGAGLYLRNREDVDPDKIGLWGGSYGGYLTALGLAKASDLFAAGVDLHGVHDWNVVIKNFVPSFDPEKQKEAARMAYDSSPMAFLDTWKSPVLIIHGDDDRNVPFSESVDLVESLRRRGVYQEQLIFPDEVHGFLLHKNWISAYNAAAVFFDRMLKK